MFDVSFSELMVIGVIALIVIGPERLPKVARTVGHLMGRAQRYVNDIKSDIKREIELDELRKFKTEMEETAQTMHGSLRETSASLMEPVEQLRDELDRNARDAAQAVAEAKTEIQGGAPNAPLVPDTAPPVAALAAAMPTNAVPTSAVPTSAVPPVTSVPPEAPSHADPLTPSTTLPLPAAPVAAAEPAPRPNPPTGTPS
jgi:sec-independent protein translocase protein TatB